MAKFLNTSKAYAEIEDVIDKATKKVVLISPYIKIPEPLLDRLRHIDRKNVKIVVVCRGDALQADTRDSLKELRNLELRFDENLHAKCFFNEKTIVIGSLNLYEYSVENNREMGILLSQADGDVFAEALKEADFIISSAEKDGMRSTINGVIREAKSIIYSALETEQRATGRRIVGAKVGYCIRCGSNKSHDLNAPYCRDCYAVWAEWQNPDYEEQFCHTCGKPWQTTMAKPQCDSCYRARR